MYLFGLENEKWKKNNKRKGIKSENDFFLNWVER